MRGDERHGYHWVQDEPPGGGLKDRNDDPLADPSWGLDAGMALVALAEATNLWPLAYDWERSTDDHRLHVRRLSIFLAHRSTRAASEEVRHLGEFLAGIRRGSDRTIISVASEAGIDPVALSLLENGGLRVDELSQAMVDRLAWAVRTTPDHLRSVTRAGLQARPFETGSPPEHAQSTVDPDLGNLLAVLSIATRRPELPVAMLGWTGSTVNPDSNRLQGPEPGSGGQGSSLSTRVLTHVLACSPFTVSMPDGGSLHLAPTIRPDSDRRPGHAEVIIGVRDNAARPVDDLEVRLVLRSDTLPGSDPSAVTNASGSARVRDVWLPDLIQATRDGLRLPIAVTP